MKLGYWRVRGLYYPIPYLLAYAGVEYEEELYEFGEPGGPNLGDSWHSVKETLGLEFPNIPYLIDGDVKLTQSMSILKYIARKTGHLGVPDNASAEQIAKLDMIEGHLLDLRFFYIFYGLNVPFIDMKYPEGFPAGTVRELGQISKSLGSQSFLQGDKPSYLDMLLFEILDVYKMLNAECCATYANLEAYYQRVKNLPKLKEYLESDRCIKWPVLGPPATRWGYKK